MIKHGWCGRCYENIRGRANWPGHRGFRQSSPSHHAEGPAVERPKKKPGVTRLSDKIGGWLKKDCPAVWAHISDGTWSDGGKRTPSTLLFTVEAGQLKACLNDREERCSLWRAGATPEEAVASLEKALGDGSADWKPWRDQR